MERARNRFHETEALFHGRHPGAATHRLGRACPAHCYPVDNFDKSLSPPRSHKDKKVSVQYSFGKAQRAVAQRYLIYHNGMTMSPRDIRKYKLPGPGHYETVHATNGRDAFLTCPSTLAAPKASRDMKKVSRKRTDEPGTTFGKASRTINFANIRPEHVII